MIYLRTTKVEVLVYRENKRHFIAASEGLQMKALEACQR